MEEIKDPSENSYQLLLDRFNPNDVEEGDKDLVCVRSKGLLSTRLPG